MAKAPNHEALYHQLGALLADMPELEVTAQKPISPDAVRWLGQASAILHECGNIPDAVAFDWVAERVVGGSGSIPKLMLVLRRAFSKLEMNVPAASKGAFVAAGDQLDAYAALARILGSAERDITIIDPYMDESALLDYAVLVREGVAINLLAGEGKAKPGLEPAARKWIAQYVRTRPISVRLAPPKALHDRLIFVDGQSAYIVTQSLKDFAKQSPASIQRVDAETAQMKLQAYQELLADAVVIAETPAP